MNRADWEEENLRELNMMQLRKALQVAALTADQQCRIYSAGIDVPYAIASDFDNWCRWALVATDVHLSNEQRSSLSALDVLLDEMSGEHNARLWTEDALRISPEWDEVRRQAQKILGQFGLSMQE